MATGECFLPNYNDFLFSNSLRQQIHTIDEALVTPFQTRRLAESQGLGKYSDDTLHVHYERHRIQYQRFYEMKAGKKLISEQQVQQVIASGRRGR